MKHAVLDFADTLRERGKDTVAFVFYAGHGVQVNGENYLIPVDEHIESEAGVDIDAVSLSSDHDRAAEHRDAGLHRGA